MPVARGGRFGIDCMNPDGTLKPHDTIYKFDSKGNVVKSFGAQMFIWPHGMHVDYEGNVDDRLGCRSRGGNGSQGRGESRPSFASSARMEKC